MSVLTGGGRGLVWMIVDFLATIVVAWAACWVFYIDKAALIKRLSIRPAAQNFLTLSRALNFPRFRPLVTCFMSRAVSAKVTTELSCIRLRCYQGHQQSSYRPSVHDTHRRQIELIPLICHVPRFPEL
jgi:hypothetical protein